MTCCSVRAIIITIASLQMISTIERLVFDFLGYMWIPIIASIVHLLFTMVGLFAAVQYRYKCAVVYIFWLLIWMGWNTFIVCLYIGAGILSPTLPLLKIGLPTSESWWHDHGFGCQMNGTAPEDLRGGAIPSPIPQHFVWDCLLDYVYVEIIHAALQLLLCVIGLIAASFLIADLRDQESTEVVKGDLQFIPMSNNRSRARTSSAQSLTTSPANTTNRYATGVSGKGTAGPHCDTLVTNVDSLSMKRDRRASQDPQVQTGSQSRGPSERRSKRKHHERSQPEGSVISQGGGSSRGGPRESLPWVSARQAPTGLLRSDSEYSEQLPPYTARPLANGTGGRFSPLPESVVTPSVSASAAGNRRGLPNSSPSPAHPDTRDRMDSTGRRRRADRPPPIHRPPTGAHTPQRSRHHPDSASSTSPTTPVSYPYSPVAPGHVTLEDAPHSPGGPRTPQYPGGPRTPQSSGGPTTPYRQPQRPVYLPHTPASLNPGPPSRHMPPALPPRDRAHSPAPTHNSVTSEPVLI